MAGNARSCRIGDLVSLQLKLAGNSPPARPLLEASGSMLFLIGSYPV
jgi:hypothetical protein